MNKLYSPSSSVVNKEEPGAEGSYPCRLQAEGEETIYLYYEI